MAASVQSIDRFITAGSPLARAGGAAMLLRATGGNVAGAAALAAIARKESEFGRTSGRFKNNAWGWGVHLGSDVNTAPDWETMARRVWTGLSGSLYKGAGITSLPSILNKYAPPSENDTALYKQQTGGWMKQMGLDPNTDIFSGATTTTMPAPRRSSTSYAEGAPQATTGGQLTPESLAMIQQYVAKTRKQALSGQAVDRADTIIPKLRRTPVTQTAAPTATSPSTTPDAASAVDFEGLTRGGGPADHHARALGNWQSDDAYDLMGKTGEAIPAMVTGKVIKISGTPNKGGGLTGYGITVRTAQGDLFFKHLATKNVAVGDTIRPTTVLGTLDGTVNGGAHLHLGGTNRGYLDSLAALFTRRS